MQTSFSEYECASKKRQTRPLPGGDRGDDAVGRVGRCDRAARPKGGGRGRPPIGLERMLRMYIAQNCFGL